MAFCVNCGTKIEEEIKFCPECGTAVGGAAEVKNEDAAANSAPTADGFDPKDVETNKAMGILAYIIFFIPLIGQRIRRLRNITRIRALDALSDL